MENVIVKTQYWKLGIDSIAKEYNFLNLFGSIRIKCRSSQRRSGFVTLWKSLENSLFFHFFWKSLETSGNIWIWDDFEFSFLEKSGKCLCPKVKNFNFKKKLFPQLSTCRFTYCLDLYSLFLSFNDNF